MYIYIFIIIYVYILTASVCITLTEPKCTAFNYAKYGTENKQTFTYLNDLIVARDCYAHAQEFSCIAGYPPCSSNGLRQRFPCKDFCRGELLSVPYSQVLLYGGVTK